MELKSQVGVMVYIALEGWHMKGYGAVADAWIAGTHMLLSTIYWQRPYVRLCIYINETGAGCSVTIFNADSDKHTFSEKMKRQETSNTNTINSFV